MTKHQIKISFDFNGKKSDKIVVTRIAKALSLAFKSSKSFKNKSFSLAIVSASEIKKLNLIYRGKNKPTDVLSFSEAEIDEFVPSTEKKVQDLGEIIICNPIVSKQAKLYGWSREEELARLLVHGLAHLCGYQHENVSKKEELKMIKFEKKILKLAGFNFY